MKKILLLSATCFISMNGFANAAGQPLALRDVADLANAFGNAMALVPIHPAILERAGNNQDLLAAIRVMISGDEVSEDRQPNYSRLLPIYAQFGNIDLLEWHTQLNPDHITYADAFGRAARNNNSDTLQWFVRKNQEYADGPFLTQEHVNDAFGTAAGLLHIENMEYLLQTQPGMPAVNQRGINWATLNAAQQNRQGVLNWLMEKHRANPAVLLPNQEGINNAFGAAGERDVFGIMDWFLEQADANILPRPGQIAVDTAIGYDARVHPHLRPEMRAYLNEQANNGRIPAVGLLERRLVWLTPEEFFANLRRQEGLPPRELPAGGVLQ